MGWLPFWGSTSGTSKENLLFPDTVSIELHKYPFSGSISIGPLLEKPVMRQILLCFGGAGERPVGDVRRM